MSVPSIAEDYEQQFWSLVEQSTLANANPIQLNNNSHLLESLFSHTLHQVGEVSLEKSLCMRDQINAIDKRIAEIYTSHYPPIIRSNKKHFLPEYDRLLKQPLPEDVFLHTLNFLDQTSLTALGTTQRAAKKICKEYLDILFVELTNEVGLDSLMEWLQLKKAAKELFKITFPIYLKQLMNLKNIQGPAQASGLNERDWIVGQALLGALIEATALWEKDLIRWNYFSLFRENGMTFTDPYMQSMIQPLQFAIKQCKQMYKDHSFPHLMDFSSQKVIQIYLNLGEIEIALSLASNVSRNIYVMAERLQQIFRYALFNWDIVLVNRIVEIANQFSLPDDEVLSTQNLYIKQGVYQLRRFQGLCFEDEIQPFKPFLKGIFPVFSLSKNAQPLVDRLIATLPERDFLKTFMLIQARYGTISIPYCRYLIEKVVASDPNKDRSLDKVSVLVKELFQHWPYFQNILLLDNVLATVKHLYPHPEAQNRLVKTLSEIMNDPEDGDELQATIDQFFNEENKEDA